MTQTYRSLLVTRNDKGEFHSSITERSTAELPPGEVLVEVAYSSLNYKDMLSSRGHPGVSRKFPHQPGIDAAGVVRASDSPLFEEGDAVIVSGYDLGMNTAGGLGQFIRVPAAWVVPMPAGLTAAEAMSYGTAGFTSALCVEKLLRSGARPEDGLVAVTGATGGVGTFALALLAKEGFKVAAATGKPEQAEWLHRAGASEVFDREDLAAVDKPMVKPRFAHGIDTLGGDYLAGLLASLDYGGAVACCGLAASGNLATTVMPFIIRDVSLLGVDCVEQPLERKREVWNKLGAQWKLDALDKMVEEIGLDDVPEYLQRIADGTVVGRYRVRLG